MCRRAAWFVAFLGLFILSLPVPGLAWAATLTVGQNAAVCPGALYTTIQSAVDAAAPGDTIHICAGTYTEQVSITKSLQVNGDNGAIISPAKVVGNSTSFASGLPIAAIVLVQGTTGVTIQNVIVDGSGNGIAQCSPDPVGIFYQNASGELNHVTVRYMELPSDLGGCQSGTGIFVQSGGGASSVVTIENSSIHDYQKNGITANEAGTDVTINGNVVTGLGTAAGAAQNGIQIGYGASGTIHANTVANHIYAPCTDDVMPCPEADDILVYESNGVQVDHNDVGVSQTGIAIAANNANVLDNTVFGSVFDGILLQGNSNKATGNLITRSDQAGVEIWGNTNTVQHEVINDAAVGVLTDAGSAGNTVSANTYYNTPVTTQDPPAKAARRASPYR
jgi:nitrous oxidase accessory protein NosD